MTFIPTAGAVRTDIQYSLWGQQVHNVLWFSRNEAWTQAQREALNTAIAAWWTDSMKSKFSTHMELVQITTVNQDTDSAPSSVLVVTPAVPGTDSSTPAAPANCAACATLRTDLRGRSYRGRMYLGGFGNGKLDDSITLNATFIGQLLTALGALKTVIEGLGAIWVVVSKYHNKVARGTGVKTPVSAIAMDQYSDSQRRRLGLRGV